MTIARREGTIPSLPFADGTYRSPPSRPGLFARSFPGLRFYTLLASIVWRAASRAKRGRYDDAAWSASSLDVVRALECVGVTLDIRGVERFAALDRPCVFVGNHMSTLETFVLPVVIAPQRPVTFVVKEELVRVPVFGHVMRSRDPILVGRANPREDLTAVLEGGAARLREGTSVIIFPQTTRTALFDPSQFNSIGVKLARRAGVPVVPLALKTDAWGTGRLVKDIGRIEPSREVRLLFGEPLEIAGHGGREQQRVVEFIAHALRTWGARIAETPAARAGEG